MVLEYSVLKVLAYFDLFEYPLTREEILFFLDREAEPEELSASLQHLLEEGRIFHHDEFYSLRKEYRLVERRLQGNARARNLLTIAAKNARFLFQFPFVRGIGISGSLSKDYADENADIDYFIITSSNRLWIARTLMHLYKKLTFLTGRQHRYCMNYYIDEQALEIEEKNLFTAIELITLKPFCGNGAVDNFFLTNGWTKEYYPNGMPGIRNKRLAIGDGRLKKGMERLFSNKLGESLDNYFLRLTTKRWKKKEEEGRLNMKGNPMGLRTGKHFSKPNPGFFQQRILTRFTEKLNALDIRQEPDTRQEPDGRPKDCKNSISPFFSVA